MKRSFQNEDGSRAFTLIELMVVVLLIAIVSAVIIPQMKGTYQDALLRSTARELVNAFDLAASRAVSFNQPHRVRINTATGKFSIAKRVRDQGRENFVPLRDVAGSEGTLDTRIKIEFRGMEGTADEDSPQPAARPSSAPLEDSQPGETETVIAFYPDGTADAVEARLQDREGFQLALRLNPTTARSRVVALDRDGKIITEAGGEK